MALNYSIDLKHHLHQSQDRCHLDQRHVINI